MIFVGVDLISAFSRRPRAIDIVVLDDHLRASFHQTVWPTRAAVIERGSDAAWWTIARCIPECANAVWAIDGPQGLAQVQQRARGCEIALGTPGRTPDALPTCEDARPFQGYIRSSIDLFAVLQDHPVGFRLGGTSDGDLHTATLFEVFPGAEWSVLAGRRLPGKSTEAGRTARRLLFAQLGVTVLPALPTADQNDALMCAYLAWCTRHRPTRVELVGQLADHATGSLREGKILHMATPPTIDLAEIAGVTTDAPPEIEAGDQDIDSRDGGSHICFTDYGAVHGKEFDNRWLQPGIDYLCETRPPHPVERFQLRHSASFSGGLGWKCEPSVRELLKRVGLQPARPLSKKSAIALRIRVVAEAR